MQRSKVRGGRHRHESGVLELHEEATTFVAGTSKKISLGHNSCRAAEHVEVEPEASAVRGGRRDKRPLELRLYQDDYDEEDEDDYEVREATFVVAGSDGAYTNFEMPKRINLGYDVGESSALLRTYDAQDERDVAVWVRLKSEKDAMMRDMYMGAADDDADAAAAPQRTT